jgi:hypothetical protein
MKEITENVWSRVRTNADYGEIKKKVAKMEEENEEEDEREEEEE